MNVVLDALSKIGFDWQVALANLVNFLIILFILAKFVFKPVQKIISERQAKINKGLEDAQKAKTELMMADSKKTEIIQSGQKQASEIVSQSQKERIAILDSAKTKAKEQAQKIMEQAQKENQKERQRMQEQLKEKNLELVLAATEKLLKKKIDEKENTQYIKRILQTSQ